MQCIGGEGGGEGGSKGVREREGEVGSVIK